MFCLFLFFGCVFNLRSEPEDNNTMWKKPWKAHKQNLIKTSDKRRFKEKIAELFPKISKEHLDLIIPPKGQITTIKVGGDSRTVIYCLDKDPIFFDIDGREKSFIPTGKPDLAPKK
jgi:hypothetical protein